VITPVPLSLSESEGGDGEAAACSTDEQHKKILEKGAAKLEVRFRNQSPAS
jgi:hypothetical protein